MSVIGGNAAAVAEEAADVVGGAVRELVFVAVVGFVAVAVVVFAVGWEEGAAGWVVGCAVAAACEG